MADELDEFFVSLGIKPAEGQGVEQTLRQIQLIDKWCRALGMSADETQRKIDSLLKNENLENRYVDTSGNMTDLGGNCIVTVYPGRREKKSRRE